MLAALARPHKETKMTSLLKLDLLPLKRTKDSKGRALPGLWENDIVRMELVEGLWHFQVPVREIGKTGYFEYRPLAIGGQWRTAGVRRTRAGCCISAEKLKSGETVLQPAAGSREDRIPARVHPWADVAQEIAEHPSVKG